MWLVCEKARVRWVHAAASALGVLLLAACAPAQAPREVAAPPAEVKPQRGGIIRMAPGMRPETMNPHTGGRIGDSAAFVPAVYEQLVFYDIKFTEGGIEDYTIDWPLVPWLAESWQQLDPTTYIFRIRKGVKWHDGTDFTAEDVIWGYEYLRDPKNAFRGASNIEAMDKMEKLDSYTVKITTKGPAPDFLMLLADNKSPILPKHVIDRGDKYEKVAIGTGPFKVVAFNRDTGVSYARNEAYWQEGKPYLDGMEIIYGLDPSAQLAAFKAKEIDLHQIDDKAQLDALRAIMPEMRYASFVAAYGWSLKPRMDRPPFDDIRVRRAVHLGIDRQAINKTLHAGLGIMNAPGMSGAKKGWAITEEELSKLPGWRQPKDADITEAKRLLAEAGYPAGVKTSIMETTERPTSLRANTEMACGQLKAIGIECTLEPLDRAMFNSREREGNYALLSMYTTGPRFDSQLQAYLHSKGVYNKGYGINDPRLDALIEKQRVTMDVAERKKVVLEMQRVMLDQVYTMPLVDPASFAAWQPWVRDYAYFISSTIYLYAPDRVWLELSKMPKR